MASTDVFNAPSWTRLHYDPATTTRYYAMSRAPYDYVTSLAFGDVCDPATPANRQCGQWRPGAQTIDANNYLRFGEPFHTYEPGHAVSTPLVQRNPFVARGEGILKGDGVDRDSSMRALPSYTTDVRARKRYDEIDLTLHRVPPVDAYALATCAPFDVRVDDGTDVPRGGVSSRVHMRNVEGYARRG